MWSWPLTSTEKTTPEHSGLQNRGMRIRKSSCRRLHGSQFQNENLELVAMGLCSRWRVFGIASYQSFDFWRTDINLKFICLNFLTHYSLNFVLVYQISTWTLQYFFKYLTTEIKERQNWMLGSNFFRFLFIENPWLITMELRHQVSVCMYVFMHVCVHVCM